MLQKCDTQIVQVHLQPFRRNSFFKVCRGRKSQKITKNPYFGDSRSFKVIDVDINKKLVTIACYDKQLRVCAYLQPFSCYTR